MEKILCISSSLEISHCGRSKCLINLEAGGSHPTNLVDRSEVRPLSHGIVLEQPPMMLHGLDESVIQGDRSVPVRI